MPYRGFVNSSLRASVACCVLALVIATCSASLAQERRGGFSVAGALPPAQLTALTEQGGVTLTTNARQTTWAPGQLVVWGSLAEPRRGPLWLLADGGWLAADPVVLAGDELRADSRLLGEVNIPRSAASAILFRLPADRTEFDRLVDRVATRREAGDLLLLANGDELTGQAQGLAFDPDTRETHLKFRPTAAAEAASLPLHALTALYFNPVLTERAAPRGPHAVAGLRDGSKLVVAGVAPRGGGYDLMLACGLKTRLLADDLSDDVIFWQPLGAGVVYLSDLPDAGYRHIPFLTRAWPFFNDRNCHGHRLRGEDALYLKGLGMRTTSRLAYDLDGDDATFAAELALDRSAGARGSVIFRVFTAEEGTGFRNVYESPVIRGGDAPLPIAVDIRGARRLALIVDFAERGDEGDDANWLNARLMKGKE